MPPEDEREEEEPEEEHRKVDKRASRDVDAEPAEDQAEPEEAAGELAEEPEPVTKETEAEPAEPTAEEEPEAPAEEEEGAAPEISVYGLLRMSIGMYAQQAWIHMGVRMDPSTQKTEQNMPLAKVAIDTVAFVVEQLQPDLTEEEKRELDSLVADLRINYVQRS